MKALLLIFTILLLTTSCEETGDGAGSKFVKGFASVQNLLFVKSSDNNKYLIVDGINSSSNQIEVITYRDSPTSNGKANEAMYIFKCSANGCLTDVDNSFFLEIKYEESETAKKIYLKKYLVDNSGNDRLSSNEVYYLIED